ncbi:MAG: ABC transporter ATP-binding protein [Actinomycetota bacterium]
MTSPSAAEEQSAPGGRRSFLEIVRRYRRMLALQTTLALVAGLAEAFVLVMVTRLALAAAEDADRVAIPAGPEVSLTMAAAASIAAIAVKTVVGVASAHTVARLFASGLTYIRRRLVAAFFRADWETISSEKLGDLQTLVTGHAQRVGQALLHLSGLMLSAGRIIVILGAAVVVSPIAAALAILFGGLVALAVSPFTRATKRYAERLKDTMRLVGVRTTETTRLAVEARAFGVEDHVLGDLDTAYFDAEDSIRRGRLATQLGPQVYQNLALLLIVIGAATVASLGSTDVADIGATLLLLLRSFTYAQGAQAQYQSLVQALPFIDDLMRRTHELEDNPARTGSVEIDHVGDVVLDGVTFAYGDAEPVLRDVHLTIGKGETVGVIGPSGAGKSTLIQLILGLRRPTRGRLLFGGVDLDEVSRADLRRLVAYVPQEPRLMSTTVAENLRFFRRLTDGDLREAAERANILDDVLSRDGGFEASVGPAGAEVSGGQRQRLTIARALAARPEVLILDEPTSSLDDEADRAIQAGLGSLHGEITVIVITHRASTLQMCDRVLRLDGDGTVREDHPAVELGIEPQ